MRIVFFGTADFAVPSLEALVAVGHQLLATVTAPDKPAGRGQQLKGSPVKEAALRLGLPLLQPEKLKADAFLAELQALQAELFVVVAFRMLPEAVWSMPPAGTVNLHGSLLPDYRGAAPIHWAVINGERETGVTTFFLRHEIDTGDMILQARTHIGPDENTGQVYNRLQSLGAALLSETVNVISGGNAPRQPQPALGRLHHAPKLTQPNTELSFAQPATQVYNFIRGLAPYPIAWAQWAGGYTRFISARLPLQADTAHLPQDAAPGTQHTLHNSRLLIACKPGYIEITELQTDGKKRLPARDWLNGRKGSTTNSESQ